MMTQKLPWIITAILAALLIIVTFLWLNDNGGNISAQRDVIRETCPGTDDASRTRCQQELSELSDMLQDFIKETREVPQAQVQVETAPAGQ